MFRSALTITAFLTALPAFAGSVPVVSSTSVVNPPVTALPPQVSGGGAAAPGVSAQVLADAALDLIGPTGGGTGAGSAPPDTVRLGGPISREQRRQINSLLSQIENSVGGSGGLIRPLSSGNRSSF